MGGGVCVLGTIQSRTTGVVNYEKFEKPAVLTTGVPTYDFFEKPVVLTSSNNFFIPVLNFKFKAISSLLLGT